MSVDLDDREKVLAQKNRRTKAKASEKVGKDLTYQLFCLTEGVLLTDESNSRQAKLLSATTTSSRHRSHRLT